MKWGTAGIKYLTFHKRFSCADNNTDLLPNPSLTIVRSLPAEKAKFPISRETKMRYRSLLNEVRMSGLGCRLAFD